MTKINQSNPDVPTSVQARRTASGILYKRANIWVTTSVVLLVIVAFIFSQIPAIIADNGSLATASYASNTAIRNRLRNFFKAVLLPASTTSTTANTSGSNNSGQGAATAVTVGATTTQASAIPTGSCAHLNNTIPHTFSDSNNSGGGSSIEARDAAWRASIKSFPGPETGPGAPTIAATGALPNVNSLFAVVGVKSPFQFSAVKGKDAFTVINPQGGIAEKYTQVDIVVDWGDGKVTSSFAGNRNYDHVYTKAGTYTIKAKAYYFCYALGGVDAHGRPSPTAIDPTKPIHADPASPESTFSVYVAEAADGANAILSGPSLLMTNGSTLLTNPGNVINQKNKVYLPSDNGGPERLAVVNVTLKNAGTSPVKVQKILVNDTSVFARQSDKRLWVKKGGSEIGSVSWPILTSISSDVSQYGNLRTVAIPLSTPLTIAAGQTESVVIEVQIVTAKTTQVIPSDISHQFAIAALELPEQALPDDGAYRACGRDTKSDDGGKTYIFSFPPGCGEPFEIRNNPNTPIGSKGVDTGSPVKK